MRSLIYRFWLLLLLGNPVHAQDKSRFEDPAHVRTIANARQYVDSLRVSLRIPGLSVSVSVDDQLIWSEGFGYADVENQEPVLRTTKFRIGSVSKSLTSIAMAKLAEEDKLELDEYVQNYLPEFPKKKHPFTVRQLATHQAGIPHYRITDILINRRFNSVDESLEIFKDRKLKFEPGTDFQYSTFGYVLLSAVIERVSNTRYLEYMENEIFGPLGVNDTEPDDLTKTIMDKSSFYKPGKPKLIKDRDLSYKWAGGGYLSTSDDLVQIIDNLSTILSKESIEQLWTPVPLETGEMNPQSYALGWRKYAGKSGLEIVHHGGVSAGGRAFVVTLPKDDITVAILANSAVRYNLQEVYNIAKIFKNSKTKK